MSYVESNLMQNEQVVCSAKVHWCVFMPGFILLGLAILNGVAAGFGESPMFGVFFMASIIFLVRAHLIRKSTELAVTSKRVIVKTGMIRRHTVELNHSKVESFQVSQGIFGRMLGYGTLTVTGTGGVRTPINGIDNPLEFRRSAVAAVDATQSSGGFDRKAA
jgi:uncharacterized membrane protein YdbT with pleckstrin-like domain